MTAAPALTIAPSVPAPRARHGIRAPKGGCTVAGRTFKGGQFCLAGFDPSNPHGLKLAAPAPAPVAAPKPALDITRLDGTVVVADPETGDVDVFSVAPAMGPALAGKRVVSFLVGDDPSDRWAWKGFAFADDFGLSVWSRFAGRPEVAGWVEKLTESARFPGLQYRVTDCR